MFPWPNSLVMSINIYLDPFISKFIGQMWNRRMNTRNVSVTGTMQSWQNKTPIPEKMQRRKKKGHKHWNPSRNQEEPAHHDGTQPQETSPGTWAGTRRNREIMMEQNPFREKRKKRKVGRQWPQPYPEQKKLGNQGGTSSLSWETKEEMSRETSTGTIA